MRNFSLSPFLMTVSSDDDDFADDFDEGYFEEDSEELDLDRDEQDDLDLDDDGVNWDDSMERSSDDGWFYDDDEKEDYDEEDGFSYFDGDEER